MEKLFEIRVMAFDWISKKSWTLSLSQRNMILSITAIRNSSKVNNKGTRVLYLIHENRIMKACVID